LKRAAFVLDADKQPEAAIVDLDRILHPAEALLLVNLTNNPTIGTSLQEQSTATSKYKRVRARERILLVCSV
jgi:hypothetical protein